jgi:PhnB protein
MVDPIPQDYPRLMPYLLVHDAAAAIDFYAEVFGATERMRMPMPDGTVAHAALELGDSLLMLADESEEFQGPRRVGGTPVGIMTYVADVDAVAEQAVARGATITRPLTDEFYGDRSCTFEDPFGHKWHVHTQIEDLTEEEMARRMAAAEG